MVETEALLEVVLVEEATEDEEDVLDAQSDQLVSEAGAAAARAARKVTAMKDFILIIGFAGLASD